MPDERRVSLVDKVKVTSDGPSFMIIMCPKSIGAWLWSMPRLIEGMVELMPPNLKSDEPWVTTDVGEFTG